MSTILLLRLNEPDGVAPSDAIGNLDDLGTESGITAPTRVVAWSGHGRRFVSSASNALVAGDALNGNTLAPRDVTIQALLSLTLSGASGPFTVIARGIDDGTISERYAYGLELDESTVAPGLVEVRMFWMDSSGALVTAPAGVYDHPGDGVEIMLTATRRWERSDRVVVRYYVADEMIAEVVVSNGDISGGTTGHTSIGARKSAGNWGRFLSGTIDELLVANHEMSPAEVRHTWARLTEYQPGAVDTLAGLTPVGLGWADDLSSNQGRRIKVAGLGLGIAVAQAEELRAMWLPGTAPLGHIEEWERGCGLSPRPRDSLEVRQARVLAFGAREGGYSVPSVKEMLTEVMDTDAPNIEIVEFTNEIIDAFDGPALDTERWLAGPGGALWSVAAGSLVVFVPSDEPLAWGRGMQSHLRLSIDPGDGPITMSVKVVAPDIPFDAPDAGVGIYLHDRVANEMIWFGVFNTLGATEVGYRIATSSAPGVFVPFDVVTYTDTWLRLTFDPSAQEVTFAYSTTSEDGPFVEYVVSAPLAGPLCWAGFAVVCDIDTPTTRDIDAHFQDFRVVCPQGVRPYYWYAYRDPMLGGEPDMLGAELLVQKIKPAHTHGAAISSKSLLADDPVHGRCDHGPGGGF